MISCIAEFMVSNMDACYVSMLFLHADYPTGNSASSDSDCIESDHSSAESMQLLMVCIA